MNPFIQHATQCSLHFDKHKKMKFIPLIKSSMLSFMAENSFFFGIVTGSIFFITIRLKFNGLLYTL